MCRAAQKKAIPCCLTTLVVPRTLVLLTWVQMKLSHRYRLAWVYFDIYIHAKRTVYLYICCVCIYTSFLERYLRPMKLLSFIPTVYPWPCWTKLCVVHLPQLNINSLPFLNSCMLLFTRCTQMSRRSYSSPTRLSPAFSAADCGSKPFPSMKGSLYSSTLFSGVNFIQSVFVCLQMHLGSNLLDTSEFLLLCLIRCLATLEVMDALLVLQLNCSFSTLTHLESMYVGAISKCSLR